MACGDDGAAGETTTATTETSGSTSDTTGSVTTETTSPEPLPCGNGALDDAEECDDANALDGDTCRADCTLPVAVAWSEELDGELSLVDRGVDLVLAPNGDLVVLGHISVDFNAFDTRLWRFSPDGSELRWSYDLVDVEGQALAWEPGGNLVVVSEVVLVELEPDTPTEVRSQTEADTVFMNDVAIDADGAVVVIGSETQADDTNDLWVRKYDSSWAELWTVTWAGRLGVDDEGSAVAIDPSGNVYVVGTVDIFERGSESLFRKLDPDGVGLWTAADLEGVRSLRGVGIDGAGDIVVTGTGPDGMFVGKYRSDGFAIWTNTADPYFPISEWDVVTDVAFGPDDEVYAIGTKGVLEQNENLWLRRYSADGANVWAALLDGDGGTDEGAAIAIDSRDRVVAVGSVSRVGTMSDVYVAGYEQL